MRRSIALTSRRSWMLGLCALAACARERPSAAATDTAALALPAARACLAVDTLLEYDDQTADERSGDPSGNRLVFRRVGGQWSGIARSVYSQGDSLIDSLAIVPATGAIRFRLWPRSQAPEDFHGTIDCDSIRGARKSVRQEGAPIEDVYHRVRTTVADTLTLASGLVDTAAADTGLRLDAGGHPRLPIAYAGWCEGEGCETRFPAVACATAVLRQRPRLDAPAIARVRPDDTLHVDRVDLHVVRPGIVLVKKPLVLDTDRDMDSNEPRARRDTLRFAAGDTVYLISYEQLGWWSYVWRGRERSSEGFWGTPPNADDGALGVVSDDSSFAIARSQPEREYWWLVRRGDHPIGWWHRDSTHALRSISALHPDAPCEQEP